MPRPLTTPIHRSRKRMISDYAIAFVFYSAALAASLALPHAIPTRPFAFFILASLLAANRGGNGPAFLVMALGVATVVLPVAPDFPQFAWDQASLMRLALSLLLSSVGSYLVVRKREAIAKLHRVVAAHDLIARSTNDTLWEWDIANDTIHWNEAAETIFGVNRHTSGNETRSWTDNIHPADTERVMNAIERAMETGAEAWSAHYRFRKRDGSYSDVFDRGYFIRDADGRAVQMIGSMLDLSERRATQERLAESENRLKRQAQLLDLAHDAIIVRSIEGVISFWNKGAQEIYGWSAHEAEGRQSHELFKTKFPQDQAAVEGRLREAGRWDGELIHRRKDGEEIVVGSRWLLAREGGAEGAVLEINRDVTERKRYEKSLLQQAEEPSRSNQELEQFAYVASHDLQEPLRKISNFSELLISKTKGALGEESERYLNAIMGSAERMQQLIHDLLAYSRVTKADAKRAPVELSQVLNLVLTDLEARIQESKARVLVAPGLPAVMASSTELRQVFQNLIGNALKFNRSENPEVRISAKTTDEGLVVNVSDNGIGIDPNFHANIFKVFQRLHTREKFPGTGIGLAICKKIIERHGGRIWVESSPDQGATFSFTLPIAEAAAPVSTERR